jgi:hydroxymethylglutaryl-CoA synthase
VSCGIAVFGIYVPLYRVMVSDVARAWGRESGGSYEKTVPCYDEDTLTMGVEASLNALKNTDLDGSDLDTVFFATMSSPYVEKQCSSILSSALGCGESVRMSDFHGSPRAGSSAMFACLDALRAGSARNGLVVTSDKLIARPGDTAEQFMGAGAAAFIFTGDKERSVASVQASSSYSTEFTDRWRPEGETFPRTGIERFSRDYGYMDHVTASIRKLFEIQKSKPEDYAHVVITEPDPRRIASVAKATGFKESQIALGLLNQFIGDTGTASMFLSLAATLEKSKPHERILAVSYGDGGSDAFEIKVTEAAQKMQTSEVEKYLKSKRNVDYQTHLRLNRIFDLLR